MQSGLMCNWDNRTLDNNNKTSNKKYKVSKKKLMSPFLQSKMYLFSVLKKVDVTSF